MKKPDPHPNEADRQEALDATQLLDTPAEERFDRITRIAQRALGTKMALISLIDRDRQWFKSSQGLPVMETGRDVSFCGHAILEGETMGVPDATKDSRFHDNPFVTGGPEVRYYEGAPIFFRDQPIGTLCVIDDKPREINRELTLMLEDLAALVSGELERVRERKRLPATGQNEAIDPLTRAWRGEMLRELLAMELDPAARGEQSVGFLVIEVEGLALDLAAQRVRAVLRPQDSVGREDQRLLALLPGITLPALRRAASELQHRIQRFGGRAYTGLAHCAEFEQREAQELVDQAMEGLAKKPL